MSSYCRPNFPRLQMRFRQANATIATADSARDLSAQIDALYHGGRGDDDAEEGEEEEEEEEERGAPPSCFASRKRPSPTHISDCEASIKGDGGFGALPARSLRRKWSALHDPAHHGSSVS